jgi:hypothetical protein
MRGQEALCAAQDKKAFFSGNPWKSLIFFGTVEISTQHIHPIYTQKSIEIPKSDRSFPPHKGTPVFLAGHGSPGRVWLPSS